MPRRESAEPTCTIMPRSRGTHAPQRGLGAVHGAEVGHLGHAQELLGRHVADLGEDRGHRDVDPDVDRAELGLDARGGALDRVGVGDVGGRDAGARVRRARTSAAAASSRSSPRAISPTSAPRARQLAHRRAADAGRGAGDGDDLSLERHAAVMPSRRDRQPAALIYAPTRKASSARSSSSRPPCASRMRRATRSTTCSAEQPWQPASSSRSAPSPSSPPSTRTSVAPSV